MSPALIGRREIKTYVVSYHSQARYVLNQLRWAMGQFWKSVDVVCAWTVIAMFDAARKLVLEYYYTEAKYRAPSDKAR